MSKITSITCAAVLAACISTSAAYARNSMVCTDSTTGKDYSAATFGDRIKLKGTSWSANLTVIAVVGNTCTSKVNENDIFTNVSFKAGWIKYFKVGGGKSPYRQDSCNKGVREYTNHPESYIQGPKKQPYTVLDGIKAKCAGEWPGDYAMQKWCIDKQVEAYNALLSY